MEIILCDLAAQKTEVSAPKEDTPIWVRTPALGKEPHTNLNRPEFERILKEHDVDSRYLSEEAGPSGRLYRLKDIQAAIEKQKEAAAVDAEAEKAEDKEVQP